MGSAMAPRGTFADPRNLPVEAKVAFLGRTDAYPHRPPRVDRTETHMSWVFLTDRFAYKLKKPVRYDFLDFSTIEARRRDCEEEIRLNRRLAPRVYLGVVPLTAGPGGGLRLGGDGTAVDWLVKMRRLPAARSLENAIRNGRVDPDQLRRAAAHLANFYKTAPPVAVTPANHRHRIETEVRTTFRELTLPNCGVPIDLVVRVNAAQLSRLACDPDLFDRRVDAGRIVEAHGDLRPEHIFLGEDPIIIDCLEFNRTFRILDPIEELAFLAMECDRLAAPRVGQAFIDTYREVTGDTLPSALVFFYKCYRACLRARLSVRHNWEPGVRDPAKWTAQAQEYLRLAERYARRMA
jgi:aminoglycoside phosphotransferase family enzyme